MTTVIILAAFLLMLLLGAALVGLIRLENRLQDNQMEWLAQIREGGIKLRAFRRQMGGYAENLPGISPDLRFKWSIFSWGVKKAGEVQAGRLSK